MNTNINDYILKKKRKKIRKKVILISIILIVVLGLILLKTPYFNIKKVNINNNNIITKEKVIQENDVLNQNIFLLNTSALKKKILSNPYIKDVKISRKLPDELTIKVEERNATFIVNDGADFYVLNENLVIMEKKNSAEGLQLPVVTGLNVENRFLGEPMSTDKEKVEVLKQIGEVLNKSKVKVNSIDVSNLNNIVMNKGEVQILLGGTDELGEKLNKMVNILNDPAGNFEKGYINISFNGNPVIYKEK
ncbi:cell division protein FtsQ/DivIB [Clostridium sp. LIBA-8841]|uniref:cell division protein FtsQ/DivIB n=1 Tax=Clostridium sp. LIBA-8841 TaxID=2987530 RepID=UPI002AC706DA|nr:FtsQ-type POTRA domain-containing protein [Clostridium sp. LIBA-8841]MDZ5252802.1 FtsQ-type POTRA domain-containing protein [Clostridium sp. LIBA-8841]